MTSERIGPYEVLRRIGKGGMAEVFQVRADSGRFEGRPLALKRLLPALVADAGAVKLFEAEAELSRHLSHPNIVDVFEVGFDRDSIYMLMEFIDGRDVGQIVRRCRTRQVEWPVDFAVYLVTALLEALHYAHNATGPDGVPLNIVHCDVSPSNFFVSRTGDLKLADFGVARSLIEGGPDDVLGKPYYLSPEALEGIITPHVDLWAVGVTLYELLTLKRPFPGKTPDEVFDAIRHSRFEPVRTSRPSVPQVIEDVLARAFDVDPTQRFQTPTEFAEALGPLYDERIGTPLAISAIVRGLFGAAD